MEQVLGKMRDIIREGGNIVVLAGMNITYDMGLNGVNAEHLAWYLCDTWREVVRLNKEGKAK